MICLPAQLRASQISVIEHDEVVGQLVGVNFPWGKMFGEMFASCLNGMDKPFRRAALRDFFGQSVDDLLPCSWGNALINAFIGQDFSMTLCHRNENQDACASGCRVQVLN